MNNKTLIFTSLLTTLALTACGSSSDSSDSTAPVEQAEPVQETVIQGPFSTGSVSEPSFVFFDLETMTQMTLTEEESKTNTEWDVAFKRTDIYLNNNNSELPVSVYATDKNSDFFDADGNVIADTFINATPESELDDFTAVMLADVPTDNDMFAADETKKVLDGFYAYDSTTHVTTADDTHAYIVDSDGTYTKFRTTSLATEGFDLTEITLTYSNQTDVDTAFALIESDVVVNTGEACAAYDGIYVDFTLGQIVSATDNWDVSLPCNEDKTAAGFELNLADDATAMQDFDNTFTAIDLDALRYYDFEENEYNVRAFDSLSWYQYGLDGGFIIWSQYGVYTNNELLQRRRRVR